MRRPPDDGGAGTAMGGEDEDDPMAGVDRSGDGAGADQRLIVGVGVEEDDGPGGHRPILSERSLRVP